MRKLNEMIGQQFIMRCVCGMKNGSGPSFTICDTPYYNEAMDAVFCERCQNPVFVSLVDVSEIGRNSSIDFALMNNHFTLHSDKDMMERLEAMREKFLEDQREPTIPVKDLTLSDILDDKT